jgi:hypothetical protein
VSFSVAEFPDNLNRERMAFLAVQFVADRLHVTAIPISLMTRIATQGNWLSVLAEQVVLQMCSVVEADRAFVVRPAKVRVVVVDEAADWREELTG